WQSCICWVALGHHITSVPPPAQYESTSSRLRPEMQSHGARGSLPASRMAPALDLARLGVLPVALVSALAQLPPLWFVLARQSTEEKALQINVDAKRYGTFAEIGAGQEVARWFFHVGGAAGTVAKTISAYDTAVSDALYGPSDRYVSRQRLEAMLDRE